ncbi:MAG: M20/M25/M40 family metallo-hydrolase [Paracoccaceae bacterium]|nr:M20/M25/M40 family metallo-hydrolase [Paracoccaceae bacterium]
MQDLDSVLKWLDLLVAVDTTPGRGNAQIIDMILQHLAPQGIRVIRVPSPLGDADGLVLSAGPEVPGGLILSGHLDVVPVRAQDWASDPFRLTKVGDKLFGRGTCDMKGFIACALAALQVHSRALPDVPLHIILSADEETSCRSIETLVDAAKSQLPPVRGVLVGEPTMMVPANRHKASATHHVTITGRAVHASLAHRGADAVALAARLITWLAEETARSAASPAGSGFDPDYDLHTATRIEGGTSLNTVADTCSFDWDMRLVPGRSMVSITDPFDAFSRTQAGVEASVARTCTAFFPGLEPRPPTRLADSLLDACSEATFASLPYGTEAGFFQTAGFDTYVCGPGDPRVAHLANECIDLEQLATCIRSISYLLSVSGNGSSPRPDVESGFEIR